MGQRRRVMLARIQQGGLTRHKAQRLDGTRIYGVGAAAAAS